MDSHCNHRQRPRQYWLGALWTIGWLGCAEPAPDQATPEPTVQVEAVAPVEPRAQAPEPPRQQVGTSALPAQQKPTQVTTGSDPGQAAVAEALRAVLDEVSAGDTAVLLDRPLHAPALLADLYAARDHAPVWPIGQGAQRTRKAWLQIVDATTGDGLTPGDYHADVIRRTTAAHDDAATTAPRMVAIEDVLWTDSFLVLGRHLLAGKVDSASLEPHWQPTRRRAELEGLLEDFLRDPSAPDLLERLRPQAERYDRMVEEFLHLSGVAQTGGWGAIPPGTLEEEAVANATRRRLWLGRLLPKQGTKGPVDDSLREAIRKAQELFGLKASGDLDPATRAALDVPLEARLAQLRVNLERMRWQPESLGDRHVIVDIAGAVVNGRQDGRVTFSTRAVVGKVIRKTPVFSDAISYMVLNPRWTVPRTVLLKDLLKDLRRNPQAVLQQKKMRILAPDGSGRPLDPATIAWQTVSERSIPFRLEQAPGSDNALGRIKFMFPNKHNVYLHDTPRKDLFDEDERNFSSGCVRLHKPVEFAHWLLDVDPRWPPEALQAAIDSGNEQTIRLTDPVPIYLMYRTAWADSAGRVHYRKDLYARDAAVNAALDARD